MADSTAEIDMWTRLEAAAEATRGMFTEVDVVEAMRAWAPMGSTAPSLDQEIPRTSSQPKSPPRFSGSSTTQ